MNRRLGNRIAVAAAFAAVAVMSTVTLRAGISPAAATTGLPQGHQATITHAPPMQKMQMGSTVGEEPAPLTTTTAPGH